MEEEKITLKILKYVYFILLSYFAILLSIFSLLKPDDSNSVLWAVKEIAV